MNIELRNIRHNERLSEETHCYSATLYLDGKPIAEVGNRGFGGCDDVHALNQDALAKVEAYFKTLPPLPTEYKNPDGSVMTLTQDLELWCSTQVDAHIIIKELKRSLKREILYVDPDKKGMWKLKFKGVKAIEPKHIAYAKTKYPQAQILNELPEAFALQLFRQHGGA